MTGHGWSAFGSSAEDRDPNIVEPTTRRVGGGLNRFCCVSLPLDSGCAKPDMLHMALFINGIPARYAQPNAHIELLVDSKERSRRP